MRSLTQYHTPSVCMEGPHWHEARETVCDSIHATTIQLCGVQPFRYKEMQRVLNAEATMLEEEVTLSSASQNPPLSMHVALWSPCFVSLPGGGRACGHRQLDLCPSRSPSGPRVATRADCHGAFGAKPTLDHCNHKTATPHTIAH